MGILPKKKITIVQPSFGLTIVSAKSKILISTRNSVVLEIKAALIFASVTSHTVLFMLLLFCPEKGILADFEVHSLKIPAIKQQTCLCTRYGPICHHGLTLLQIYLTELITGKRQPVGCLESLVELRFGQQNTNLVPYAGKPKGMATGSSTYFLVSCIQTNGKCSTT